MPLDPEIAATIKSIQDANRAKRESNRRRFPLAAQAVDALEPVFGKVRVVYAFNSETGDKVGKQ